MKKGLMMLGAAAIALASCTQNEVLNVSDSRAIGFNGTGIDNITKADITSSSFDQFYVYGGYTEKEDGKAIFDNISVTKSGSTWGYNPTQYWVAGTWFFAGYAGGEGVTPTWDNATGKLTLAVNSNADNQDDVIFAANKGEDSNGIKVTDPATYNTQVSLSFTHLLSKIQFKFTKEVASLGGVTVTLQNFKVAKLKTNATWIDGVKGNLDASATGDYTDFTAATEIDGEDGLSTAEFYVIPQDVQAFAITADAVITDANSTIIKSGTVTATVPTTGITKWDPQTKYVYTAELKYENIVTPDPGKDPKPIEFTGSASDWTTGSTGTITPTTPQP